VRFWLVCVNPWDIMTVEVKTFVDLGDFVALRFTCQCGGRVDASLMSESKLLNFPEGLACPHCHRIWFEGPNDKRREAIMVFLDRFVQLRTLKMPFGLQLEVAGSLAK
jgi:hypothetical protein